MNLRFVSSFIATADLGSFAKAADALFSTQATIASRVARLEEELGVPLFLRDGSTLVLTEHGHAALPLARKLIESSDEMIRAAGGSDSAQGVFRLAWTDYASFLLQPGFLIAASDQFPRLNFEIFTHSSMDVLDRLQEGRTDIGILVGAEAKPNLVSRHLFDLPLRWICKTGLIDGDGARDVSVFRDHTLLAYPVGTLPAQAVDTQLQKAGVIPARTYCLDTLHAVLSAVRSGLGIALIPPPIVQGELTDGRLVLLDVPVPLEALQFHAQYRRNARAGVSDTICDIIRDLSGAALSPERPAAASAPRNNRLPEE